MLAGTMEKQTHSEFTPPFIPVAARKLVTVTFTPPSDHSLHPSSGQEQAKAAATTMEQAQSGFDGLCPDHECSY